MQNGLGHKPSIVAYRHFTFTKCRSQTLAKHELDIFICTRFYANLVVICRFVEAIHEYIYLVTEASLTHSNSFIPVSISR